MHRSDSGGNALRPGTYAIIETPPNGYIAGTTTVGTVGGSADGTLVADTKISSIALTSGQFTPCEQKDFGYACRDDVD